MIGEWFSSVNVDGGFIDKLTPSQFGKKIRINLGNPINFDDIDIIICSLQTTKSSYDRELLYQTFHHFDQLTIADLGVFKSNSNEFILKALKDLKTRGYRVIILDATLELTQRIIKEISDNDQLNNILVSESNQLDVNSFPNYDILAYQKHKCSPANLNYLTEKRYNSLSLGSYRDDYRQIEPILRDAQMMAFHPNATQFNKEKKIQIGLNIEESCQIMKYAGFSDRLKILSFIQSEKDFNYAVADMCWYYLEGQNYKISEDPSNRNGFQEYVISSKEQTYDFSFIKSETTGRWWLKTEIENDPNSKNHYLSCSKEEYDEVCIDNVPQRFLKYLSSQ